MICFPNCKINLGLYITGKRTDGFHNLETTFYPIDWCDALEAIEHPGGKDFELQLTGMALDGEIEDNIIYKCWQAVKTKRKVPPLLVHLLKKIPTGAGLGGGSSDAAFFLKLLNDKLELGLGREELMELALGLGSDCPFFLENRPMLATGRGEVLRPLPLSLHTYYIVLVFPGIHSSTGEAFQDVTIKPGPRNLEAVLRSPVENWKDLLANDFEPGLFKKYPRLSAIKSELYASGAHYAAMSGSGSTLFGIFGHAPDTSPFDDCLVHLQAPAPKIL